MIQAFRSAAATTVFSIAHLHGRPPEFLKIIPVLIHFPSDDLSIMIEKYQNDFLEVFG